MADRIDAHTHFLPRQYRERLKNGNRPVRIVTRGESQILHHSHGTIPLRPGFRDIDERLEWMVENDIDRTVVSVSTPNPNESPFSVAESVENVRAINDGFAEIRSVYPDRIVPLASLPLRDPDASLEELDRIDGELDLGGVALPTAVNGTPLYARELEPVFDRIDALGLPVFLHPTPNCLSDGLRDDEWAMNPLAIFPTETTVQVCRLIFDGFFDRHDLDVVIAHLGGALPYLVGRFERGLSIVNLDSTPDRSIDDYLTSFYYDAISFHPPAIHAAIETVGADRLLFGSDYPFGIADVDAAAEAVEATVADEDVRRAIFGETATSVFCR